MCGIAGYITKINSSNNRIDKIQGHRGPDDSGQYTLVISNKTVHFTHNRLSIIDLSAAGHQPMISDDGNIVLIYNGELYNYEELRKLYLSKDSFHSKCDTEVVLHLYQKLGIRFVKELNGDFALAILDKSLSKVFLIRDHFGIKPLYFNLSKDFFAFGSEIKAILAAGVNPELNTSALANYFVLKYSPLQETLFSNIYRLPPAHYLEYDIPSGNCVINPYWRISKITLSPDKTELKHQLYDLIKNATEIRLMADVPVGTFFSGGIDSSIIASFLKSRKDITHYTARKSETDLKIEGTTSDYHFACSLAAEWNLNLVPVDISSTEANLELINEIQYYSDDLIADGSQIPSYLITKKAKNSSVVILSGMGADEIFCGYKGHILALLANYLNHLPDVITKPVFKTLAGLNPGRGYLKAYKRHLKQFGKYYNYGKARYGLYSVVGDYVNAISLINKPENTALTILQNYFENDNSVFDNLFHFDLENFLVKNLHYVDRMCMANSMEGRVPFLDFRVVEFAYSLPVNYKISPLGDTKYLLKETFKGVLPSTLIHRRKAAFGMPLRSILSSREKVNNLINFDFFYGLGHFSIENINRVIENHISGREDNSALMYALISFQQWYKMWIEGDNINYKN
jgi:asparagine synthase (glutamine-hydrolysing)